MIKIDILNIKIQSIPLSELLSNLQSGILFTPNVDHIVKLQKDREFYEAYKEADWIICDSKILNHAAKFLGMEFSEVIPGSSFLPAYYLHHKENKNTKVFLLGAREGVAVNAMKKINDKVGWNMVVGAHSPSFGFENNDNECAEIIDIINKSNSNVLVVGVGAPKQEKWIIKYRSQLSNVKLFMALGATIDFEAGNIKRAPAIYQRLNIEWFYRLIKEPKRLWRRYLIEDTPFFAYILKQKFGIYKNPFS
ncbi:acetyl-mannosamine transferase [Dyadobacter frigoris]|uniref:WecB/TagA/CpsF family glycosyltransferase n=1 Tax=Dyadobacter frigoris TaxID=2576211 RepID=UPI0024A319BE|nr:WecB/TagA/CpsF family glycosyltransferase [Dyadobacter frigoris]GLU52710.1 acetyl-mannosamine transferase [Dyadobacter frigoris]